MAKTITPDVLGEQMQKGFARMDQRMDTGFAAVADDIARLNDRIDGLATKEQVIALHTQTNSIERELHEIKLALTHVVYREDLDAALERIAAIERHLGLNQRIAA